MSSRTFVDTPDDDTAYTTPSCGLTSAEVQQRIKDGHVNELPPTSGRTVGQIIRANVFTRINAILAVLLSIVLFTGSWINGAFGLLIIANSIIGIIQELRAKRTLDKLSIVGRARPLVIRDGKSAAEVDREDVVVDDLIQLGPGDQVVVDGIVRSARGLDVDESPLTGESVPVHKSVGDPVYSGTHVTSGAGTYQATKVGSNAYAAKLAAEASKFTLTDSELFRGINKILKVITWILIPVGALTIYTQLFRAGNDLNDALLGMVASLVPMIPEGLVLMTTIAFAIGVVRLGKRRVLVNELPAIEGLARVDIVCADKTGTLTENSMHLGEVLLLDDSSSRMPHIDMEEALEALAAVNGADERPNLTGVAIAEGLAERGIERPDWVLVDQVFFTSERKWAGASFDCGTWVLGAPDVLVSPGAQGADEADRLMQQGLRVLLLAQSDRAVSEIDVSVDTAHIRPVALVVLKQTIRPDAEETIRYFWEEDVEVKVISGDNAASVGAVGRELGIPGADHPTDARALPPAHLGEVSETGGATETSQGGLNPEFADAINAGAVFGRVTAEQKRTMVSALKDRGHVVAMTGDGVNDVLALKDANIGVAMGAGAPATRSVAQLVLLDNEFAVLPHVVAEGRRVIGNIERVANLFLTKTIYSVVLALAVGLIGYEYPFQPIHVTVTGWFTIGIPAFILSLAPNHERARPGFATRVFRLALPAGLVVGLFTFGFWLWVYPGAGGADSVVGPAATATLVVLIMTAFWVLAVVSRPYQWWKIALLATAISAYCIIFLVPPIATALQLYPLPMSLLVPALLTGITGASVIEMIWQWGRIRALRDPS
ncbi:HAD-IC family P-type ATPase [Corynebacterium sp. H113]|uniref:HAD-IC family P-type ATPase n=1 Tax=Corynebacterium sp. H113 TaxID=3133419 RepID=UPI0030A41E59